MTALIPNPLKPRVTRHADRWLVECPCGYEWHTEHHRLAVLLAVHHTHRKAVR